MGDFIDDKTNIFDTGDDQTVDFSASSSLPQIAGFQINRLVGAGGMGRVFLGRQLATNREVAIKILNPSVLSLNNGMQVFIREASIAMQLKHVNIVETIDFGLQERVPFLIMEYLDCLDLRTTLAKSSPAHRMRMASGVTSRILAALQYAHDMNFVHRDIKPANVLSFKRDGKLQVKISDFGLAKNFSSAGQTALSVSNEVKGTLAYMAPEQIEDCRYAKPACDIYSAGACLYEYLSGKSPYVFGSISDGISMKLSKPPVPLQKNISWILPDLAAIVSKAMSRNPNRRFESATQMRLALEEFTKRTKYEA